MRNFGQIKIEKAETNNGFLVTSYDNEGLRTETMHLEWKEVEGRIQKFIEGLSRKARQII